MKNLFNRIRVEVVWILAEIWNTAAINFGLFFSWIVMYLSIGLVTVPWMLGAILLIQLIVKGDIPCR